ncbi:ethanolamine ammonia-lyase subunit EutB, partial [Vibrio rotiferianus]
MTGMFRRQVGSRVYHFNSLAELMAKATPERSGDVLAGVCADSAAERVVAQMTLAELPLKTFLNDVVIPYEKDEVTRLIIDQHDQTAFTLIEHLTVGDFRDWLVSEQAVPETLQAIQRGLTPEMVAAVSKIMRNQDLILVAKKCHVVTAFRNTIGLPSRLSTRLQPNHPTDSLNG